MSTLTTKDGTQIYFKDWGKGRPIVFSHGWPLSADDWDAQMLFFLKHGYRVVAHDRRGHGRSSQTGDGHDMDHYADDLATQTDFAEDLKKITVPVLVMHGGVEQNTVSDAHAGADRRKSFRRISDSTSPAGGDEC
jgi:pimeloyl-ACP methyl ester carboxylesterase